MGAKNKGSSSAWQTTLVLSRVSTDNRPPSLSSRQSQCMTLKHHLEHYHPPADEGLDLIYQDDCLLVLNKPAGLLSVPGRGEDKADCLISRVQQRYPDALIVHRLDMATSGLIVLGRGAAMQRELSVAFMNRKVDKHYLAVVAGIVESNSGSIDLPLIIDWPNRPRQKVDFEQGKEALTHYRVLHRDPQGHSSRVELKPFTGRTHQLRLHMCSLGHPILGDDLYASPAVLAQADRLLLHAAQLSFWHPITREHLVFDVAAPF
ncbi:RluA family pseudouridine synthase [Neisseriaceae bacterium TC5R-5]|nr:RluA family pseudouridine synthase [Neisseriaceae bacterium TC5R-5]